MYTHGIQVGRTKVTVGAWSPDDAKRCKLSSWSLRTLQIQEDIFKHHALANGVRAAIDSVGAQRAYAPSVVTANAVVVSSAELENRIPLGKSIVLYRNKDIPADGVFLEPGEAFVMSGAGCPVIIAIAGEYMIVAHAGRDSLIERNAVFGKPSRKRVSIVYAMIEALAKRGAAPEDINMCMQFSIPTEMFEHSPDHPEYGAYNRALATLADTLWHGCVIRKNGSVFLDMESLFVEQAREVGIRCVWAMNSLAEFPALAHTRDTTDPSRRNLFVIKRNT